jgi:hypothetical protein
MIIYFIVFVLLIILNEVSMWRPKSKGYYIGMFILLVVSAFRTKNVGTDTITYVNMFVTRSYDVEVESGFKLWIDLIREFTKENQIFIFLTSFLQLITLYYSLFRLSKNVSLSVLLFFGLGLFFFYLSGMRQSVALSFFILSLYEYKQRKYIQAISFFAISLLFHSTVVMYLPICLLLDRVNIPSRVVSLAIISSVLVAWFELFNIEAILGSLGLYDLFMGKGVLDRYKGYSEYTVDLNLIKTTSYKFRTILLPSIIALYFYLNSKTKDDIYTKLYVFGIVVTNVLTTFPLGFRIGLYGVIFGIVVIPNVINGMKMRQRYMGIRLMYLYSLITISFMIKNAYEGINSSRKDIVPYHIFGE